MIKLSEFCMHFVRRSSRHLQIEFNVNEHVQVKLTDDGIKILRGYYNYNMDKSYSIGNGWYRFQLHELAHIYGEHLYNGNMNIPFETTIKFIIKKKDGVNFV